MYTICKINKVEMIKAKKIGRYSAYLVNLSALMTYQQSTPPCVVSLVSNPTRDDTKHQKSGTHYFLAQDCALQGKSMEQYTSCHKLRCHVLAELSDISIRIHCTTSMKENRTPLSPLNLFVYSKRLSPYGIHS